MTATTLDRQPVRSCGPPGWPVRALDCTIRRPESIVCTIVTPGHHTYHERTQA